MSSIASFYLIDTSKLPELADHAAPKITRTLFRKKVKDTFPDYLAANARPLEDTDVSGYLFTTVLVYLDEEKMIHLLEDHPYQEISSAIYNMRDTTLFIFTHDHREKYGRQLSALNVTLAELQKFNQDFSEDGSEETARLSLEAIMVLKDHLEKLERSDEALLLFVG